jgi:hypothetical protein
MLDAILKSCTFPGYAWHSKPTEGGHLVWASFNAPCSITGTTEDWITRKWYVSQFACYSEIVGTLFLLVMTALEHEARENFKVDGVPPFDPHMDVRFLRSAREAGHIQIRDLAVARGVQPCEHCHTTDEQHVLGCPHWTNLAGVAEAGKTVDGGM